MNNQKTILLANLPTDEAIRQLKEECTPKGEMRLEAHDKMVEKFQEIAIELVESYVNFKDNGRSIFIVPLMDTGYFWMLSHIPYMRLWEISCGVYIDGTFSNNRVYWPIPKDKTIGVYSSYDRWNTVVREMLVMEDAHFWKNIKKLIHLR